MSVVGAGGLPVFGRKGGELPYYVPLASMEETAKECFPGKVIFGRGGRFSETRAGGRGTHASRFLSEKGLEAGKGRALLGEGGGKEREARGTDTQEGSFLTKTQEVSR